MMKNNNNNDDEQNIHQKINNINNKDINDDDVIDLYYKFKNFRPKSSSIITINPEIKEQILQQLQQKQPKLYENNSIKEEPEEDEDENINDNDKNEKNLKIKQQNDDEELSSISTTKSISSSISLNNNNNNNNNYQRKRRLSKKFSDSDLKIRSIIYGDKDPEDLDFIAKNQNNEQNENANQDQNNEQNNDQNIDQNNDQNTFIKIEESDNQQQQRQQNDDSISAILTPITKSILKSSKQQQQQQQQQKQRLRFLNNQEQKNQQNDNLSIGECSIVQTGGNTNHNQQKKLKENEINKLMYSRLINILSIIYAIILVLIGSMITIGDIDSEINNNDHLYSIIITIIGIIFLLFIHIDIQKHKYYVLEWQKKRKELIELPLRQTNDNTIVIDDNDYNQNNNNNKDFDAISVTTAIIFNRTYKFNNFNNQNNNDNDDDIDDETKKKLNSYRFLIGKHSSNFFLKIGMAFFCMGSIVHQGINLSFQIHYFITDVDDCSNTVSLIVYLIRCLSAFYQLYIAFKYSNIIINNNRTIVKFGFMHLVGSSLSFWVSTIIEEAKHGYMDKITYLINKNNNNNSDSIMDNLFLKNAYKHHMECLNHTLADFQSIDSLPLLYPFTVEFNIILASVWFIIWSNINNNHSHSQLQIINEEFNENQNTGRIEINYHSNIKISADFHASNFGLFGGFFSLLLILITIIIFFTTIEHDKYKTIGINIFTIQLLFLIISCTITIIFAFIKTIGLNIINLNYLNTSQTIMDDLLLIIPLPFYYIHHLLCIYSEITNSEFTINSLFLTICYLISIIQVTIQTIFIIDGIRRCSNDLKLRRIKPGKQFITFIIIINITLWILITFEMKSVDKYHSMGIKYGKFVWMVILDTCLPLILFYRFHSSVCLADMWKNCYEKDEH